MNKISISLHATFHTPMQSVKINSKVSLEYRIYISTEIGCKVVNRKILIYIPLLNNNKS